MSSHFWLEETLWVSSFFLVVFWPLLGERGSPLLLCVLFDNFTRILSSCYFLDNLSFSSSIFCVSRRDSNRWAFILIFIACYFSYSSRLNSALGSSAAGSMIIIFDMSGELFLSRIDSTVPLKDDYRPPVSWVGGPTTDFPF